MGREVHPGTRRPPATPGPRRPRATLGRVLVLTSPAADRNRGPIADVLERVLPLDGLVLEIASGSGQHAEHFAARFPNLVVQPSDPTEEARASVAARRDALGARNLRAPLAIDVLDPTWPTALAGEPVAAIVCINMIHIAPPEATDGLFRGAAELLAPGAPLVLYGPFRFSGRFHADSNEAFDADLRRRDPRWGVRDVDDVTAIADAAGFDRHDIVAMPANNHVVVFRRR